MGETSSDSPATGAGRGISFPFISLEAGIARAQVLFEKERRNAMPVSTAMKHWGYGLKSSGGRQTVAALSYYGLIEDSGSGDDRHIRLTNRAIDILLAPSDSLERATAIKDAARSPKLYAELLSKYSPESLPSDDVLKYFLLRSKNVSPISVDQLIKNFRETVAFAGLADEPAYIAAKPASFQEVTGIGAVTLAAQNSVVTGTAHRSVSPPPTAPTPGFRQEVFSLDEGSVTLQWPANIGKESFQDLEAWLALITRKIGRTVENSSTDLG